jgi:hypothetical protein
MNKTYNMKKVVRLSEQDLVRLVKKVIKEQDEMQGTKCKNNNDCADALDMHMGGLKGKYKKIDNGQGRFFYVGTNQYGDSIKVLIPEKGDSNLTIIRKPKGILKKSETLTFKLPESLSGNNISINRWKQYLK